MNHSNLNTTSGDSQKPPTSRVRFCSAPSASASVLWPPQLPNSFWSRLENGARSIDEKVKSFIFTYAPIGWRNCILEQTDAVSKYIRRIFNQENRLRFSNFWSSNILNESPYAYKAIPLCLLLILVLLVLQTILTRLVLGFALPLYVLCKCVDWFTQWRATCMLKMAPLKMLNRWWCAVSLIEFIILLISLYTALDSNKAWLLHAIVWYGSPFIVFLAAKYYLDHYGKGSVDENINDTSSCPYEWLLEYFILTYGVRCFAIQGFSILPESLRVFAGYVACYLAAHKITNKPNTISISVNNITADTRDCSSTSADTSILVDSFTRPATVPQLLLPTQGSTISGLPVPVSPNRNRFHLSESDSALRTSMAGRGSRRVSLPAGSLLPVKAAQSSLSEARGMLADMLAQKDLPPHLVAGLKAVSSLLVHGPNASAHRSQFEFLGNLPQVLDSPYIGSDVSLASVENAAQRRQSPAVAWSTTTSATGLPTLEPEPSRARSSSYWKSKNLIEGGDSEHAKLTTKQSIDLPSKLLQLSDGTIFDLDEIKRDTYLSHIKEWNLPIFDLYADAPGTILSRVAYTVFQKSGLFRIFKINKQKFMSFFHALEQGYWNIPYHNRIHATDVLHATYYFTSNKTPAFSDTDKISHSLGSIGEQFEDETSERTPDEFDRFNMDDHTKSPQSPLDDSFGTLASVLSSLELMGLYTAAAMHDYDHPGRTNAFLVAIQDKKATLYNDRSVLENHHAASAWQLLTKPENNFIEQLDAAEFKRFRYIIIEAILATDLKRHFEILMDFNGKVAKGLDWENEVDKLLACQICIKMADINSPAKPAELHKEWTDRILQEFYAQGDEEKERGLPVSPYMDRHDSQLARLQDSFIAHLVAPLAQAMNEAGLLPLTVRDSDADEATKSELLVNLENNHKHWKIELGEDPGSAVQATPKVPVFTAGILRGSNPGSRDADEMDTIEEQEDEAA